MVWKFVDFSATQILGEINFGLYEAPKTAILTVYLNFEVLGIFDCGSPQCGNLAIFLPL